MKNLILLLFVAISISLFSCNGCDEHSINSIATSSSQKNNIEEITPQGLLDEINSREDATIFFNAFDELRSQQKFNSVKNYLLPDSTTKKLLKAARIIPGQTKSAFFNQAQINALFFNAKKDPSYNSTDTLGVSIYFGEYTKPIIDEINNLHPNAHLTNSLIGNKTVILCPSILLKNGTEDSLVLLKAINGKSSLNVGELCPVNCPKNDFYEKDGSILIPKNSKD